MDNMEEAELLKAGEYRQKCAEAIAEGVLEYLNIESKTEAVQAPVVEIKEEKGVDEPLRVYQNGSTKEDVYADTACTNKIGSLNPRESCDCFGIFNSRAMVRYKVDGSDNHKIGFVKWLGGVK